MTTVTVKMTDILNGKAEVERIICASNIMVSCNTWNCNKMGSDEQIIKALKLWITERAEAQHDTMLDLVSYQINN
jgi:hypothetical protein